MKTEIPENRTKAYWEKEMPYMLRKTRILLLRKSLRNLFLLSLLFPLYVIIYYPPVRFEILVLWGVVYIFFASILVSQYWFPLRKINKNNNIDILQQDLFVLKNVEGSWGQLGVEWEPELHPINKLFPDDITVFEFIIKCRNLRKTTWLSMCKIYCIGTPEKRELIEKLIHMKEGVALRHESRVFKVTYKKYSRELVKIELSEDEEYPAHCNYEELVERINVMF